MLSIFDDLLNLAKRLKDAVAHSDDNLQEAKDSTDTKTTELTDSGWQELTPTVQYRKKNGVVYISGRSAGQQTIPASTYYTLGTLPEGYRPTIEVRLGADTSGDNGFEIVALATPSGLVRIWCSGARSYWDIFGCFPVGGGSQ